MESIHSPAASFSDEEAASRKLSRWLRGGYIGLLVIAALALSVIHQHVGASLALHAEHAKLIKLASDEEMLGILVVNQIGELGSNQDSRLLGSISIPEARWNADEQALREGLAPFCAEMQSLCEHHEALAAKQRQLIASMHAINADSNAVYAEAATKLREQAYVYSVAINRWTQELATQVQELVLSKQRAMSQWLLTLLLLAIPAFILMLEPAIKRFKQQSARAARLERDSSLERHQSASQLAAERARAVAGEQRLRQITNNVPVWIAAFDRQLVCQFANGAFLKHLKLEGSVIGASVGELMGTQWLSEHREALEAALAGNASRFDEEYEENGSVKTISIEVLPEGQGARIEGFIVVGANITERKRIERTLTRQSALLSATSALAGVGSWRLSLSDNRTIWTEELKRIYGLKSGPVPQGIEGFLGMFEEASRAKVADTLREVREQGSTRQFEEPFRDLHGQVRWMKAICSLHLVDGNQELLAAVEDVTDRYEAEAALRAARDLAEAANVAKSQFLANMSHEMRTPLNGVIGMISLLLDSSMPSEQQELLQIARSSGESLLQIISDVLDLSKIEAGKLELEWLETDVRDLVEQAVDTIALKAAEKELEIIIDVSYKCVSSLRTDPTRLRQVLLNLLSNAVKFTERGEIVVTVAEELTPAPGLSITVTDSGIGMDELVVQRLFAPFSQADASTTRRFGGTGLGLAISRRLVTALGGSIVVRSQAGAGSTFKIILPLPARSHEVLGEPARCGDCWVAGTHERQVSVLVERALESGLRARRTQSAEELAGWCTALGDAGYPRLVLVDLEFLRHAPLLSRLGEMSAQADVRVVLLRNLTSTFEIALRPHWFTVTKPIKPTALAKLLSPGRPTPATGTDDTTRSRALLSGKRVLLVDDNAVNQMVAARLLIKMGVEVSRARDGLEALKALATMRFDAVLMDCQMPVMDGYAATREFRKSANSLNRNVPIIALTADAFSEVRERCLEAGMDGYLTKPVDPDRLKSALLKHLAEREAAA